MTKLDMRHGACLCVALVGFICATAASSIQAQTADAKHSANQTLPSLGWTQTTTSGMNGFVSQWCLYSPNSLLSFPTTADSVPIDHQQENYEAQAAYYTAQTETLSKTWTDRFWDGLAANFAPVITAIGALFAGVYSYKQFNMKYAASREDKLDSQFAEALKSFGDGQNPMLRSSAAELLGQLGLTDPNKKTDYPQLDLALSALLNGLRLENNPVVMASICDAASRLIPLRGKEIIQRIYEDNLDLQRELIVGLANLFVSSQIPDASRVNAISWDEAARLTPFVSDTLRALAGKKKWKELFSDCFDTSYLLNTSYTLAGQSSPAQALADTGYRLSANISLCACAMKSVVGPLELNGVFLCGAEMQGMDLSGWKLEGAQLDKANLSGAHLQSATLRFAHLIGTNLTDAYLNGAILTLAILKGANLTAAHMADALMHGVQIDSYSIFLGADWWKANFAMNDGKGRTHLPNANLDRLYSDFQSSVPQNSADINASLHEYISSRRSTNTPAPNADSNADSG